MPLFVEMSQVDKDTKAAENDDCPCLTQFPVNAPDTAEEGTEKRYQHEAVPQYAFSASGEIVFQYFFLVHQQEEREVGKRQQGHAKYGGRRGGSHQSAVPGKHNKERYGGHGTTHNLRPSFCRAVQQFAKA